MSSSIFSLVEPGKSFTKTLFDFDKPRLLILLTMESPITITFFFLCWVLSDFLFSLFNGSSVNVMFWLLFSSHHCNVPFLCVLFNMFFARCSVIQFLSATCFSSFVMRVFKKSMTKGCWVVSSVRLFNDNGVWGWLLFLVSLNWFSTKVSLSSIDIVRVFN